MELLEIKNLIIEKRKLRGLSQSDLAKVLGISQPAYSKYESEEFPIPLKSLKTLDMLLDLKLNFGDTTKDNSQFQSELLQVLNKISESLSIIADNSQK